MISKGLHIACLLILLSVAGCADIASLLTTPTPVSVTRTSAPPQPVPSETQTSPVLVEAQVLRVWLPPIFDPEVDTAPARLLKQRLAEFRASHRGLEIDVRIKAIEGKTGLLNALSVTGAAAPSSLPDLIALSRVDLEAAAGLGLLHPMDGLSTLLEDPSWYPFARELGHIQNIGYGLPFAADALVLIRHPDFEIHTWADILSIGKRLFFPPDNSRALALLSFYTSAGGRLVNEQGLPVLEEQPLTQTLTLFHDGLESGTFSASLFESTTEQSIQATSDRLIVNWAVNSWTAGRDVMQPIPGEGASPHAFANGWLWALAGSAPDNQQLATELAEFLMEDSFLGEWTHELGYLPTRITLADSQNTEIQTVLKSAQVLPSDEVIATLSPIITQAVSRVLNGEQVEVVVRSVMEEIQ